MDYAVAAHTLSLAKTHLEEGDPEAASNRLREDFGSWVSDKISNKIASKGALGQKLATHLHNKGFLHSTNVSRGQLGDVFKNGQAAIQATHDIHKAAQPTPANAKKGTPEQPGVDPGSHLPMVHNAIKQHQAVIGQLNRAAKGALATQDPHSKAWIDQALRVHNAHRDWLLKHAKSTAAAARGGGGVTPSAPPPSMGAPRGGMHAPANPATGRPPAAHPPLGGGAPSAGGVGPGYGAPTHGPAPVPPPVPSAAAQAPAAPMKRKRVRKGSPGLGAPMESIETYLAAIDESAN